MIEELQQPQENADEQGTQTITWGDIITPENYDPNEAWEETNGWSSTAYELVEERITIESPKNRHAEPS